MFKLTKKEKNAVESYEKIITGLKLKNIKPLQNITLFSLDIITEAYNNKKNFNPSCVLKKIDKLLEKNKCIKLERYEDIQFDIQHFDDKFDDKEDLEYAKDFKHLTKDILYSTKYC